MEQWIRHQQVREVAAVVQLVQFVREVLPYEHLDTL